MQTPIRILVLADSRSFHTERYVRELRRQGCRVVLASLEHGSPVHVHLRRTGPFTSLHYLFAAGQARKLVRRFNPHLVNAHFATGYGWMAERAKCGQFVPVVLHLWGSDILQVPHKSPLHRWKARLALAHADLTLGDSQYLLDEAAKVCPMNQSAVHYWGIEREFLALGDTQRPFSRPLRVIVPRHHETVYNNAFLLEALAPLLREKKITLTVPSFGSLVTQFRRQAEGLPSAAVQYYDRMPRDRFMLMMSLHDVYLSASRSDSSPASLIEAMGLGLVPAAADIAGVREWLTVDSGFSFELGNAAGLRQAMLAILDSSDNCREMRVQNKERVKQSAIFENTIADTMNLMLRLVKERP